MEEKFSAVVVAGIAVFGLVFVIDHVGVAAGPENQVLMQKSPADVGDTAEDVRTVRFGSFTVGEARGDILVHEEEKATLKDVVLGDNALKFTYDAVQPTTGKVEFEVLGTRGSGKLYVKVNGEKIFSEYLISTGTPKIEVPREVLRNGENMFEIGTDSDFLKESTYTIEEVEVRVNDRKFHDRRDTFQMYSHELKNFVGANMTFSLPVDSSIPSSPMKVYVNDNLLFNRTITRSIQEVRVTSENADLAVGENSVKFETDGQAMYSLRNVGMNVRYVGNVEPGSFEETFELEESRLSYANRRLTEEKIEFKYIPLESVAPIDIELNDFNTTLNPERGLNTVDIPENAFEKENRLSMESSSAFRLNSFQIISERG